MQTPEDDLSLVEVLRWHYAPTIEMLRRAVRRCPDDLWDARREGATLWKHAYHAIFCLDVWLRDSPEGFLPPPFHTRDALLETGLAPSVTLSCEQIEGYLARVDARCAAFFGELTPDMLVQESEFFGKVWTVADRILVQIRHVQHHVGHMNCMLKRGAGEAVPWLGYNE